MFFSKYINLKYFLISFLVGIACIYFWGVDKNVVVIYPNPYDRIQYKDKTDKCFEFDSKKVTCPQDESKIKTFPIQ